MTGLTASVPVEDRPGVSGDAAAMRSLFFRGRKEVPVPVIAAGRANGMRNRGAAALAEYDGGHGYMMMRAAHSFFGFGFFVLLHSHGNLLAIPGSRLTAPGTYSLFFCDGQSV
jgi:hypothetical protein